MNVVAVEPVRLTGVAALREGWKFARDPLTSTRHLLQSHGPCVILAEGLPFARRTRAVLLGVPLVLTASAAFQRELLSAPETWRGASLLPGGPRGSAARRMSSGLTRLTGDRHAHYRRLLMEPLGRLSVEVMTRTLVQLAVTQTAAWPVGTRIDLNSSLGRMVRNFALELLFGGDNEQSRSIIDLVSSLMERKWDWRAFAFRVNLPITSYGQIVRDSDLLEHRILQWTADKHGRCADRDLGSIITNSTDADGERTDDAVIVGQLASLFAAAVEATHSTLLWTLLLIMQHPAVEAELLDELDAKLGDGIEALSRVCELVYLDAVVKESMRILPPVPLQIRVARCAAAIAGHGVPAGTRVMLNTFLVNRTAELYPAGDAFRPGRWSTIAPAAFEFPVFSAGPHNCPGFWFGSTAVKVALAAILKRLRIELAPEARIDYRVQPTLRPRHGVPVLVHHRDGGRHTVTPIKGDIRGLVEFPF